MPPGHRFPGRFLRPPGGQQAAPTFVLTRTGPSLLVRRPHLRQSGKGTLEKLPNCGACTPTGGPQGDDDGCPRETRSAGQVPADLHPSHRVEPEAQLGGRWVGEAGRAKGFPPRFRVSLRIWASLRRPLGRDPRSSWWGQGIEEKFREPGHLSPCPRLSDGPRALRTNKHFGGMFKRNWQVVERGAPGRWRGEGRSPLEIEQEHRGRQ